MEGKSPQFVAGITLAALGAFAFSGKAIIVKLAYRYGVDPVTLIMLRMLFALPVFALLAWWASRGKPPLSLRDALGVLGLGFVGYYLSSFLDFLGLQYVSASLERLILYLNRKMKQPSNPVRRDAASRESDLPLPLLRL